MDNREKNFCTCSNTKCPRHPINHDEGCTPCVKDNLAKGKVPACIFKAVGDDLSEATAWTIKGFVEFYHKIKDGQ